MYHLKQRHKYSGRPKGNNRHYNQAPPDGGTHFLGFLFTKTKPFMCTTNEKPCKTGKTDAEILSIVTDSNPPAYFLRHLHTMLIGYLRSSVREDDPQHERDVYDTYTTLKVLLEEMDKR